MTETGRQPVLNYFLIFSFHLFLSSCLFLVLVCSREMETLHGLSAAVDEEKPEGKSFQSFLSLLLYYYFSEVQYNSLVY